MTRQSSITRAAALEKPGPAFIARFALDRESVDFPVSESDLDRDTSFWRTILAEYGVGRGSRVVVLASGAETPWYEPARRAVATLGGSYSNVELMGWDARRLDMYCRRLDPIVVLGLGRVSADGLAAIADLNERLGSIPVLLARPDAVDVLSGAGVTPRGLVMSIGPALAVTPADGGGLAYDTEQWLIEVDSGELLISSLPGRAAKFDQQRTGVRGAVQQTSTGPRLMVDA